MILRTQQSQGLGANAPVLAARFATDAKLVPATGHAFSLSHPQAVTDFLVRHLCASRTSR